MTTSRTARVLLLLAAACAVAAVWLACDSPDIDGTTRGDDYTCAAPYDTAWNGEAPNVPGGEPAVDAGDVVERCTGAGELRFMLAVTVATGAVALLVCAGYAHRSARRESEVAPERRDRRTTVDA